jgi:hypothetical protein
VHAHSLVAYIHLGSKAHPGGGAMGEGTSPGRIILSALLGDREGTADNKAFV